MDNKLTRQDYNEIWYLVDHHGTKMWNDDQVKLLLSRIRNTRPTPEQE